MNELKILQGLSLQLKVAKTKLRINEAIDKFGSEGLYVSISGGKDSMVLHHLIKQCEIERFNEVRIKRVYVDTGLEYPEVKKLVYELRREMGEIVEILRPQLSFNQVIEKYGYPIISKEQSQYIHQFRSAKSEKTKLTRWYGNKWGRGKISEKWKFIVKSDFNISDKCCEVMKKKPFKQYEKITGKIPFIGKLACESSKRTQDYLKQGGCSAFTNKRPKSEPLGFWVETDILEYIKSNNLEGELLSSVYGEIVLTGKGYKTTLCERTGCVFCAYGLHLEENDRFLRLKQTHPKLYDYCMGGGEYKEGKWVPKNGLGMRKVLKEYVNKQY